MMIEKNLHKIDRLIRGIIGCMTLGLALFNGDLLQEPVLEILIAVFGILNLISLVTGWCPVYQLASISTRPTKK